MERYLIGVAHSEFTLAERGNVDDRSLDDYLRSNLSSKQETSLKSIERCYS